MISARHLVLLGLFCWSGPITADPGAVEGRWLTQDGDGWVEISLVGSSLEGRIAGAPPDSPNAREIDDLNPDPDLRGRPLLGLVIMSGFDFAADGKWKHGTIYDPNSGKTYRCTVTLVDQDTLKIRGYVGVSVFGRSETWTRDDPDPDID